MTKKFIGIADSYKSGTSKHEFLIPDVYNQKHILIGIESGDEYSTGVILFTGVDLNVQIVLKKAYSFKKLGVFKRYRAKRVVAKYLKQIKALKIGDLVKLNNVGDLQKCIKVRR